ncbi:ubiquitin-binding protein cue5 [Exophiala xenobiotica]|nr:ubiquitin-binding protein cue5 [Exophiala xenobiotica]
MANNGASSPVSPLKPSDGPPESPTTARPLDFDSDQETGTISTPTKTSKPETLPSLPPKDDAAPPTKPPRPMSPREQAELTLKEAFPTIDTNVIRAVLAASGGHVEPAFNALLGMTDPDSQREPEPPARPPRPAVKNPASAQMNSNQSVVGLGEDLMNIYPGQDLDGQGQAQTQTMYHGGALLMTTFLKFATTSGKDLSKPRAL